MNPALNGKKIAVIGLGISNIACINYLLKHDLIKLSVFDTRENPPHIEELPVGIDFHLGPINAEELKSYDILVLSPGLSINMPEVVEAQKSGAQVVGDIELFAYEAKAPIIGITGSNGKSTVTTLVGYMADKAGLQVAIGANIGTPVFNILSNEVELYVLELSSFELETTRNLHLKAGVILNISEDHLDRYHGSITEYTKAKKEIYHHCEVKVTNRDDSATFDGEDAGAVSFGLDNQSYGREVCEEGTFLTVNGERIINTSEMRIYGVHNQLNALAAMALADAAGISRQAQVMALKSFSGLPHRCQLVRKLDGVNYYNDSKATNVASTEAAIMGLKDLHKNGIILLAGGLGKGQDFTPLKRYIGHEVCDVFCFGKDAKKILDLSPEHCHSVVNMRQALRDAKAIVKSGQAILLSPACASFDQFKGFEDRGHIFVNMVTRLQDD